MVEIIIVIIIIIIIIIKMPRLLKCKGLVCS
jgi:hypothetical protein